MDIRKIIAEMSLEEKASFVSGATAWTTDDLEQAHGVPAIFMCDGPHGLRKQDLSLNRQADIYVSIDAVCFPTACATAASFDRQLMENMGTALGKECQAEDVAVILGPAVNIKRSPLCGRNFEYISEDPYAAGELAASLIGGIQSQHVGTSIKHFAANNYETERMYASSEVDERTLREIYFPAFETAVRKQQPWTVMCSYNRLNGVYVSENEWLLTQVLRKEWGFEGLVMSDWGAVADRVKGILAGLDLEMPESNHTNDALIAEAVKSGALPIEKLDLAVENILRIVERFTANRQTEIFDRDADHEKSVRTAEECIVLLKNDGSVLPLKQEEHILFVGGFAETPRFQGGGSSHINAHKVVSANAVAADYGHITYTEGFAADSDARDEAAMQDALRKAASADKIVVFAGLPDSYESEGFDRTHMDLPQVQNELISRLTETGKPVIVVLHNGSPVTMPWVDQVQGIVEAYLCGEGVGEAVMNIIYGRVNPSGKLSETFPRRLEDTPCYLNLDVREHKMRYAEGVFVGYRYYDTKKMDVLFPFGYGLSYTSFAYSNPRVIAGGCESAAGQTAEIHVQDGADVLVDITNTGAMAGKEIVQLYIADHTGQAQRPVHELKGFEKVALQPGETKTVRFHLDQRSFAYFSERIHDWYAPNGSYTIEIAQSSRDINCRIAVQLTGSEQIAPVLDADVQIGELLAYDKLHDAALELLQDKMFAFAGVEREEDMTPLDRAMIQYMPLRTLRSFIGCSNEEVNAIVARLKEIAAES